MEEEVTLGGEEVGVGSEGDGGRMVGSRGGGVRRSRRGLGIEARECPMDRGGEDSILDLGVEGLKVGGEKIGVECYDYNDMLSF